MPILGDNPSDCAEMVLPALTHERPLRAYAPRGRRKTGDAQSRLRAYARSNLQKTSPWHSKDQRTAHREQKIGFPIGCSLLAIRSNSFSSNVRFADLVVMAERLHPIPFRTRP